MSFFDDDDDERRRSEPDDRSIWDDQDDDEELLRAAEGQGNDPGIALLLEMARSGDIDPWNIDIIDVTDKYLSALARRARESADGRLDPADLARSARCIFYAAALLNMKARALAEAQARALVAATETDDLLLEPDALAELNRRGLRPGDLPLLYPDDRGMLAPRDRRPRERAITLLDLIAALRSLDERAARRDAELAEQPAWDSLVAFQECIGGSHQDHLEQDKVEIRAELARRLLLDPGARVEDTALAREGRSRAQVFLALLSLSNDEEVDLEQERIYGPLFVKLGVRFGCPPVRPAGATPAEGPAEGSTPAEGPAPDEAAPVAAPGEA